MSHLFFSFSLLLVALALLPLRGADSGQRTLARGFVEERIVLPAGPFVVTGMSREAVLEQFGPPGARLSPNLWVYWSFKAIGYSRFDTLLVSFSEDRVSQLRLSESRAVRALVAAVERQKGSVAHVAE